MYRNFASVPVCISVKVFFWTTTEFHEKVRNVTFTSARIFTVVKDTYELLAESYSQRFGDNCYTCHNCPGSYTRKGLKKLNSARTEEK